ncbi:enoyl-CoA hydratase/isomerase family protein [Pseudonocardia sp. GCM10023141]|uniref:enoyl-CoA hydratase/isomerase family protein n=1 Tax=Pseudonocardia sp. GCM10023141 TaxID=3252653 RepID=UPI00360A32EA
MTLPGSAGPAWTDVADLATGAAGHGPVLGERGQPAAPLLVVGLDGAEDLAPVVVEAAARAVARLDRIVVGVAVRGAPAPALRGLTEALDLTLAPTAPTREIVAAPDPRAAVDVLAAAVAANPHAASVLAGVLRVTAALPVRDALDIESFAYSTLLGGPEFSAWLSRRGERPPPPGMVADPVLAVREDGTLRLSLNRPERRNAYGREVRDALVAGLQLAVLDDGIDHVVLDGAGPSFCSGGDLDEFGTAPDLVTAHLVRTRGGAARLLHELRDRTEVHVHGSCVGAGIELPAFAGRVVAAPGTTFLLPEVAMGLVPGAGGTVSIPRRIGRWRTLHLALTGAALDVGGARRWGLVDEN